MHSEQGAPSKGSASTDCVPQSRHQMTVLLASADETAVTAFVRGWLLLDDEMETLRSQTDHVTNVLNDRLLGSMLDGRSIDLLKTMHRRSRELAAMPASYLTDILCKCYVRARMKAIAPEDQLTIRSLGDSIRRDVDSFEIDTALIRNCA